MTGSMLPVDRILIAIEISEAAQHMPEGTKVYLTIKSRANEPGARETEM